ncbi:Charged multivesicular body protein [Nesidiocoris tenuis]|uniref:Charged multivesicular body protein n=1 Tax=Nesidiocoris tenuis TaxID=355587 RepID=A0ABN7AWX5_9HEMI|nr:Charged multivesicular body protein [Nesidiocoris tenuis]
MGQSVSIRKFKDRRRVTSHDKTVLKVKMQRDTVKRYQRKLENSLQHEKNLVLILLTKGKVECAKCLLRKQLVLMDHLRQTDHQLELLERTVGDLEWSTTQAKVFEGLRAGHLALKRANEVLSIRKVELILEETAQALEKQAEINKMISTLGTTRSEGSFNESLNQELDSLLETTRSRAGSSSEFIRNEPIFKKFSKTQNKTSGDVRISRKPGITIADN